MPPVMVQMSGVVLLNVTALPDAPPVALTVPVPPTITDGAAAKLMFCAASTEEVDPSPPHDTNIHIPMNAENNLN